MLKPNPEVLLDIIREIGRVPSECVYLGDSKMKDVAMAQDAGVTDVLAGYGAVQHQEEYNLLREVSHWPDVDVKREFGTDSVRPKLGGEIPGVMGERRLGGGVGREQTMLVGRDARLRGNVDDHARPLRLHDCRRRLATVNRAHIVDVEQKARVLFRRLGGPAVRPPKDGCNHIRSRSRQKRPPNTAR